MKVLISGISGLIGSALKRDLERDGHTIKALPRTYESPIDFEGVDAIVHLAGESIADGRWTEAKKRRIEESRVKGTAQLVSQMNKANSSPSVFICASAIGYYGDRGDEKLDETSENGSGYLPGICKKWEEATLPAEEAGIRTIQLRTGIVLSKEGGALKKMLTPFQLGAGGLLGNGRQYMSWISIEDEISIIRFILENGNMSGPINVVSPNPVTNKEFTKILATHLKRPAIMPMPAFAARILFGEMADALLLSSTRVYPRKIIESGYSFKHTTLESALRSILK